ncbi:calumenin-A-like isoform X2 [Ptychodera flava]|uniref:calumenin-A-like isoform X2 n=1 Tax=Ptychodera flava TaxID=63121 RepID=UPI003969CF37
MYRQSMRISFNVAKIVPLLVVLSTYAQAQSGSLPLEDEKYLDVLLGEESHDVLNKTHVKGRLEKLFRMMDRNSNNRVDKKELKTWVYKTFIAGYRRDCAEKMKVADTNEDGKLSWNETKIFTFGELEDEDDMTYVDFAKEIEHDQKRFHAADADEDGLLSIEEFYAFLHPEMYDHLQDFITWKFFDDFDRDGDGGVTQVEYIGPNPWPDEEAGDVEGEEPSWVPDAIERFNKIDTNGNGKLEQSEVLEVLLPNLHISATYGAKLIMEKADDNNDGKLSVKEVKKHYKVFIQNQEIDFDGQIRRIRDEL